MILNKYFELTKKISQIKVNYLRQKIKRRKMIWHVCTPKSGSTYFMNYLNNNLKNIYGPVVPVSFSSRDRLQTTCPYTIVSQLNIFSFNKKILTSHQHAEATEDFLRYVSKNHKIIVQTRGILDTIISFVDHLDKNSLNPHIIRADLYWPNLTRDQKIDNVILHYLPWHLSFLKSWLLTKNYDLHFVNFKDVVTNTRNEMKKIFNDNELKNIEIKVDDNQKNFNKGLSGRGKIEISEEKINMIRKIVKDFDHQNLNLEKYI